MAFYESPRFPDDISYGATGGPGFLTNVVAVESGAEYRDVVWAQSRCAFDVAHAARRPDHYQAVRAFFLAMRGRAHGFRFKDWSDYAAGSGEGIFSQITSTTFQMVKRYTSGAQTYDRTITKPISGTVSTTGGTVASIDYATGIVTMTSGTPTAWTGQFDVPCRFDVDRLAAEILARHGSGFAMGIQSIPIVEIRV